MADMMVPSMVDWTVDSKAAKMADLKADWTVDLRVAKMAVRMVVQKAHQKAGRWVGQMARRSADWTVDS